MYIVKKVGYKNVGKNQRLEAFYMLMERGQTDLPHNGVLCSFRKEWLFLFRHGAISQLLQMGKNYIARQSVCLHMIFLKEYTRILDVTTSKHRWVGKRDLYFSV